MPDQERADAAHKLDALAEEFEQMDDYRLGPYDDVFITLLEVASNLVSPEGDTDRRTQMRERSLRELEAITAILRSDREVVDAEGEET